MTKPTMGNLFSGAGTWELAAKLCGIDVLWEAEIEPFPVALEAKRFPEALQLGDVSKVHGGGIPKVDIFTNSSPCTDVSLAGKREGLAGARSGLFYEAVRIAKEMREDDIRNGKTGDELRPRFWCFENVPGLLSSNKGEDFRTVLEEIARIADETASVPEPPKGRWGNAGVVDGDGWQIAWRTMDAQYFGVPQRRRRIFLSADLAGHCAAEILFEQKSIDWNFAQISDTWKDTSRSLGDRISAASEIINGRVRQLEGNVEIAGVGDNQPTDSRVTGPCDVAATLAARYGTGGCNTPIILHKEQNIDMVAPEITKHDDMKLYEDVSEICLNDQGGRGWTCYTASREHLEQQ